MKPLIWSLGAFSSPRSIGPSSILPAKLATPGQFRR
jgi:hypothetical protein